MLNLTKFHYASEYFLTVTAFTDISQLFKTANVSFQSTFSIHICMIKSLSGIVRVVAI